MAGVDLYGNDASAIRNAYKSTLRRDASDDEVSGWLSGSYGGGGLNDWLGQISRSGEAQQYQPAPQQPPVLGPSPGENHTWNDSGVDQNYANTLSQAYQDYLGRAASPDELNSWWSGAFGYGSGWDALNSQREAIRTSGEARTRNNGQAPNANQMNLEYWQGQGVNPTDMFDTTTGQLKPGWEHYVGGYRRTTGAPTTGGGDLQAWLKSVLTGASSPQALAALEGELNKRGIRLQKDSAGNVRGRLYLPDGSTVDVVSQWGQPWTWIDRGAGGPSGPSGPPTQYSDPYTKFLEQLLGGRIQGLMQPVNDPNRQMYEAMLKQRADTLGRLTPELDKQIQYLESRFKDLQGNGYTGAEGEAIRTGALDPIEQDRSAAKKRMAERLAARNIGPDSGVFQQAMLQIDNAFDSMRGTTQTALTTNDLNRREDRKMRAENIRSTLSQIPEGRAREQLDVFSALNQLSLLARQEDEARQREAVGYGGALADLGPQRLQLAMQAAGMGGNPSSMFQNLMQLAGMNQNASMFGAQNQQSLWSGLGSIAAMLANAGR